MVTMGNLYAEEHADRGLLIPSTLALIQNRHKGLCKIYVESTCITRSVPAGLMFIYPHIDLLLCCMVFKHCISDFTSRPVTYSKLSVTQTVDIGVNPTICIFSFNILHFLSFCLYNY